MFTSKLIGTVYLVIFSGLGFEEFAAPIYTKYAYIISVTTISNSTPMLAHSAPFYFCFFSFSQIISSFQFSF